MPYIHIKCGGEIGLWTRKCHKCEKVWPLKALFALRYPSDMIFQKVKRKPSKLAQKIMDKGKGTTSYAKWADNAPPGVAEFASHLPNWPRWARILFLVSILLIIVSVILLLRG